MWLFCQVSFTKHCVAKVYLGGSVYPPLHSFYGLILSWWTLGYFFAAAKFL